MRHRFTIKELEELSDLEIFRILCWERQSTCTNIQAPIYKKMDRLIESLDYRIKQQRIEAKKEEEDTRLHIEILHHDISYYLDDDSIMELGDCESEQIEYMIGQGYIEGELNKTGTDDNDGIRGYWSITSKGVTI